ncbi:MAG: hypothetical protein JOZ19_03095 [Rubrobacter sp.]|nr:hypothetical protein [Rubrobacter sp.]
MSRFAPDTRSRARNAPNVCFLYDRRYASARRSAFVSYRRAARPAIRPFAPTILLCLLTTIVAVVSSPNPERMMRLDHGNHPLVGSAVGCLFRPTYFFAIESLLG